MSENTARKIAKIAGKEISCILNFKSDGSDFAISNKYEKWLVDNGYSLGFMQTDDPRGIAKGNVSISKWRNISMNEYKYLDGVVLCDDNRNGTMATIYFFG